MNSSDRYRSLVAVYVLLVRDRKILLLQRHNTGYRDGDYDVPAGHLEDGETLSHAALREAKEEASVMISDSDLRFSHLMHRKTKGLDGRVYLDCYFIAKKWIGEPKIGEPDKCLHMDWFSLDDLPKKIIPYQAKAITFCLKGQHYSVDGWD